MRRLVISLLMVAATHGLGLAFPLRIEQKPVEGTVASWKSSGPGIRSLWYSRSGELVLIAGSDITRWKYDSPRGESASGRISDEFTQIIPKEERFLVLSKTALEPWGIQDNKFARLSMGSVKNDDHARAAVATENSRRVFWSPGGKVAFLADDTSKPVVLKLDDVKPTGLALSPTGRLLAIASGTGSVQICNLKADGSLDRKISKRFPRRDEIPLAFSPDGRLLAVASAGRLVLLDVNTNQIYRAFERRFDDGDISTMAFSPDGALVAIGTREPSPVVRVWHIASGKSLGEFSSHRATITGLAFDTKQFHLAAGDADGRVFVWKLSRDIEPRQRMTVADAWEQLDSIYPVVGHQAMADLLPEDAGEPGKNLQILMTRITELDKERARLKKAIADLDHDEFRVREAARKTILKTSYRGMELLQDPGRKKLGAEGEERVRSILARFEQDGLSKPENDMYGDALRLIRLIQVLEAKAPKEANTASEYLKTRHPGTRIALDSEAILGLPDAKH
ncbi:WD40 repeat domain-containing protein [Zavarzinella formosa]|uniref:WD40 repeat domain-containing protein n=1 Tax=Zavarzinella formosa TaxID=360055 RepID=UPI0002DFB20A|nr:hypothetical protein [Zavarzinella formosa]